MTLGRFLGWKRSTKFDNEPLLKGFSHILFTGFCIGLGHQRLSTRSLYKIFGNFQEAVVLTNSSDFISFLRFDLALTSFDIHLISSLLFHLHSLIVARFDVPPVAEIPLRSSILSESSRR